MSLIKKPSELEVNPVLTALIYGVPGIGKAQPLYCSVLTPDGFKKFADIKVGDKVMGVNGTVQTVEGVYPQGVRPVYQVVTSDGSVTYCDEEHIWNVRHHSGNSRKAGFRNLTLKEMISKGILCPHSKSRAESGRKPAPRFEIPVSEAMQFDEKELPIHPYVLGALIGDGSLVGSVAALSNPDIDSAIAEKVEANLPKGYLLKKRTEPSCPQYLIECTEENKARGNGFIQIIKSLGLNVKSGEKFIPEMYMQASVEQRLELLRGLMDTDGTARDNRVSFSTSSATLAADVKELVHSLGGVAHIKTNLTILKTIEYRVVVRTRFNPFSLKRKADGWAESETGLSRYIVSAEKVDESECVCIKVSNPDELYITDGYIVTHNTTLACSAPKAVMFDFDGGVNRMYVGHQVPTVQVQSWEDALKALEEVEKAVDSNGYREYETIVIDTVGKMLLTMEKYILTTMAPGNPALQMRDGSLSLKGYGVRKQMFVNFNNRLKMSGRNVVYVAHEVEQKRKVDRDEITVKRPEIGGSSANDLMKELDLVGYMQAYGSRRMITFDPQETFYAKNSCGINGVVEIPNLFGDNPAPNTYMQMVIESFRQRLENNKQIAVKFEEIQRQIHENISAIENASDANNFVEWVKNIDHVLNSKAVALQELTAKATALGLVYNKSTKKYSDGSAA